MGYSNSLQERLRIEHLRLKLYETALHEPEPLNRFSVTEITYCVEQLQQAIQVRTFETLYPLIFV